MNLNLTRTGRLLAATTVLLCLAGLPAFAGEVKLEAQLIWGTNDKASPNPKHKPVDAEVDKKLKTLPFKWSSYFEVNRKPVVVKPGEATRVQLSEDCEITVQPVEKDLFEVVLFGKGKQVGKIRQCLPKKELLVTGGDAPNLTAWFVVLKRAE